MTLTRPELSSGFVAAHKGRRIIDATVELCAEQGYEATKIADIVRRAGVGRKTLYDNFDGKEELFLAALDCYFAEFRDAVAGQCVISGDWKQRVEAGLAALLSAVAERPAAARTCLVEAPGAIPASAARHDSAMREFAELLKHGAPGDGLPLTVEEMVIGGVAWIVSQRIRAEGAERVEDLLPELSEFLLSPYQSVGKFG